MTGGNFPGTFDDGIDRYFKYLETVHAYTQKYNKPHTPTTQIRVLYYERQCYWTLP